MATNSLPVIAKALITKVTMKQFCRRVTIHVRSDVVRVSLETSAYRKRQCISFLVLLLAMAVPGTAQQQPWVPLVGDRFVPYLVKGPWVDDGPWLQRWALGIPPASLINPSSSKEQE